MHNCGITTELLVCSYLLGGLNVLSSFEALVALYVANHFIFLIDTYG